MTEIVTHSNLATHSANFALGGGIYQIFLSAGTIIADGSDLPALHQIVNGAPRDLDPPIKFNKLEIGGIKQTKMLPGATFRWTVPGSKHLISTSITKVA
jgi:hypothetical protein